MARDVLDTVVAAETPEGILLELRPAGLERAVLRVPARLADPAHDRVRGGHRGGVHGRLRHRRSGWSSTSCSSGSIPSSSSSAARARRRARASSGIKVVMDNGLPVTPAASFTRNLLRVADFLPFLFGAGHRLDAAAARQQAPGRPRGRDHRRASAAAPAEAQARRRRAGDAGRAAGAERSSRDRRAGRARADVDRRSGSTSSRRSPLRCPATAARPAPTSRGACSASRSGPWANAHDAARVRSALSGRMAGARGAPRSAS